MFDRVRYTVIRESLNIDSLLFGIERFRFRLFDHLCTMSQERLLKQPLFAKVSGKKSVGRPLTR